MRRKALELTSPPDRHDKGIGDELHRNLSLHRSANDPPREQINHGGNVEASFSDLDVGEVGNPLLVRR